MSPVLNSVLESAFASAVDTAFLALVVLVVTRLWRNAHVAHFLWLLVLVKLLVPAWWTVTIPVPALEEALARAEAPATALSSREDDGSEAAWLVSRSDTRWLSGADEPAAGAVLSWDEPGEISSASLPEGPGRRAGWQALLFLVWVSGSVVWTMLVACRIGSFRRLLGETWPASGMLQQQAARFAAALGLRRCPEVRLTAGSISPMVWAVGRRPLILLPTGLLETLDDRQQSCLLAHELAHIRRRDHWIRWLELLVLAVYWWNPVAWWASKQLRAAEEECCDAWVVALMGTQSAAYAQALWKTIHWLSQRQPPLPRMASGMGGMGRVGSITRRFEMIVGRTMKTGMTWSTRLPLIAAALAVLPLSARVAVRADENPPRAAEVSAGQEVEAARDTTEERDRALALELAFFPDQPRDPDQPKAARGDDLAERLGRLEKTVMELAEAVKGQHAAQAAQGSLKWEGEKKEKAKSAAKQAPPSVFFDAREREKLSKLAAQLAERGNLAAHLAELQALAARGQVDQLAAKAGALAQLHADRLHADRLHADPEGQLRQLEHQQHHLENQLRMKELEIKQIHLELEFVHKQLEQVTSRIEKAKKAVN